MDRKIVPMTRGLSGQFLTNSRVFWPSHCRCDPTAQTLQTAWQQKGNRDRRPGTREKNIDGQWKHQVCCLLETCIRVHRIQVESWKPPACQNIACRFIFRKVNGWGCKKRTTYYPTQSCVTEFHVIRDQFYRHKASHYFSLVSYPPRAQRRHFSKFKLPLVHVYTI